MVLSTAARASADPDPARAEAVERFDRAIRLVNEGDMAGGLAEFQRAYALIPSPVVLYNLGLVHAELHRPVEAVRELTQALARSDALKPEYVERAKAVVEEQSQNIGHVTLSTNVKTGSVEVDNLEVARLPLEAPLDVAAGSHVVGVVSPGYAPARKEVTVAGQQQAAADLQLVAIEGLLAHIQLACRVPAADVFVDGDRVGKTPLDSTITVAPGSHHVEVRRAGYGPAARDVTLQDGAVAEVALTPAIDRGSLATDGGWLNLESTEAQAVLTVDGDEVGLILGPVHLPAGPHRLHVESGGFVAAERDVDVPLGGSREVRIVFEPTPDTRTHYVASASSHRAWSWVTLGVGLAVAGGGVALAVVSQSQLPGARSELAQANLEWERGQGHGCDFSMAVSAAQTTACENLLNGATAKVDDTVSRRTAGWVMTGVGGAVAVTGIVLLVTGADPHRYDDKPAEPLFARWRFLPEVGVGRAFFSAGRAF